MTMNRNESNLFTPLLLKPCGFVQVLDRTAKTLRQGSDASADM